MLYRIKNKLSENLRTILTYFAIVGIQALATWFAVTLAALLYSLDANVATLTGLMWVTYGAIPILFSSFVLTMFMECGIIFQLKEKNNE